MHWKAVLVQVITEAPYNADNIGVLDIATERFETIDISHTTTADMKCLGLKEPRTENNQNDCTPIWAKT